MTPNELAEALEARHKYDKINYPPASPLDRQAAATIRELEASNKARADIIYAQTKASKIDRDKLKIATEALEGLKDYVEIDDKARQALARIKEV